MRHESDFGSPIEIAYSAMNQCLSNSYRGHKFLKWLGVLLPYFFAAVVSIMCAYIVGTGIAANGNFNELLGGRIFSYILAGLLQVMIFISTIYLSTSRAWHLRALPMSLLLVATMVCFMAGEIAHSLLVQTKGSLGDSILRERALVLQSLHNRITSIDEFVFAAYQKDKQTLLHAAKEAKKGNDPSGLEGTGSIYTSYMQKLAIARDDYSQLAIPIRPAPEILRDVDSISKTGALNTAWLEAVARYHALRGKISDYRAMSQKIGQPAPVRILIQAESINNKIKSLKANFSTAHTITRQSAAIDETMSIIYAAMRGEIRSNAHLWAIGYAIAPTLLAIWFPWLAKRYGTTERHDIDKRIKQDKEFGEKLQRHNDILRDNNAMRFVNRFYQDYDYPQDSDHRPRRGETGDGDRRAFRTVNSVR